MKRRYVGGKYMHFITANTPTLRVLLIPDQKKRIKPWGHKQELQCCNCSRIKNITYNSYFISNRQLSSISCKKCRYAGGKNMHFTTANTWADFLAQLAFYPVCRFTVCEGGHYYRGRPPPPPPPSIYSAYGVTLIFYLSFACCTTFCSHDFTFTATNLFGASCLVSLSNGGRAFINY
jgi:hypothetical protein